MVVEVSTDKAPGGPETGVLEDNDGRAMGRTWEPLLAPWGRPLGVRRWVSERILLGKPVWDRPSQKGVEPGACVDGEERGPQSRRRSQGTCLLVRATTQSRHLCRGEEPALGRLCQCWGGCFGTPGWGPGGGGYPGSNGSSGCQTSARVLEGQSRQGLLADRAVSEIGSRPHRPLPAASPASEAGARLTCHLLRIAVAAAASSRASPAPGMQRLRQAGRCLGRAVSPHQAFSSSDGVGPGGRDSGGGSSCFELELGNPWPPIFPLADLSGGCLPL